MNCFSQVFSPTTFPTPNFHDNYSQSPKTPQTPQAPSSVVSNHAHFESGAPGGPHSQGPHPAFPPSSTPDMLSQLINAPNSVPGANVEHHLHMNGNPGSVPAPSPLVDANARQPPTPSTPQFPPSVGANPLTPQSVGNPTSQSQVGPPHAGPTSPLVMSSNSLHHKSQTATTAANALDINPPSLEHPPSLSPDDLNRIINGVGGQDDVDVRPHSDSNLPYFVHFYQNFTRHFLFNSCCRQTTKTSLITSTTTSHPVRFRKTSSTR